jgi:hypothetical protein
VTDQAYPLIWGWKAKLPERFGQACRIIVRGKRMNSVLVEFEADDFVVVTSRWAVRRRKAER